MTQVEKFRKLPTSSNIHRAEWVYMVTRYFKSEEAANERAAQVAAKYPAILSWHLVLQVHQTCNSWHIQFVTGSEAELN